MGTRSLTFVYDSYKNEDGSIEHSPIINLYRQYDGYPEGHGAELYEFLAPFHIVNGLGGETKNRVANGMGCLAAQLVHHFKGGEGGEESIAMKGHSPNLAGQFYLHPTSAKECGQDYEYHIFKDADGLRISVTDRGCNLFGLTTSDTNKTLFTGNLAEFKKFCKVEETSDEV
jgi:hypothetical protein